MSGMIEEQGRGRCRVREEEIVREVIPKGRRARSNRASLAITGFWIFTQSRLENDRGILGRQVI